MSIGFREVSFIIVLALVVFIPEVVARQYPEHIQVLNHSMRSIITGISVEAEEFLKAEHSVFIQVVAEQVCGQLLLFPSIAKAQRNITHQVRETDQPILSQSIEDDPQAPLHLRSQLIGLKEWVVGRRVHFICDFNEPC